VREQPASPYDAPILAYVLARLGKTREALEAVHKLEHYVAPLVGKQPQDTRVWILGGKAPAFVNIEGPLYQGGPVRRIEPTSPVWLGGSITIVQ